MASFKRAAFLSSVVLVVAVTTTVSELRGRGQNQSLVPEDRRAELEKARAEFEAQFPVADYNAPEPESAEARQKRKVKSARHNHAGLVKKVDNDGKIGGTTWVYDWEVGLPPLPVEQSTTVIVAEVLDAAAYLSEDKSEVYSEFTVSVKETLKNTSPVSLRTGDPVSLERVGGAVRFPSGHKQLYDVAGQNMPRVGRSYVFFLNCSEEGQNCGIVTAYELKGGRVAPLDSPDHFKIYDNVDEVGFLKSVRDAIARAVK
jgi:hypothetical protein